MEENAPGWHAGGARPRSAGAETPPDPTALRRNHELLPCKPCPEHRKVGTGTRVTGPRLSSPASPPHSRTPALPHSALPHSPPIHPARAAPQKTSPAATEPPYTGSSTVNVVSTPGSLATAMVPPCASTIWRTIHNPSP